MNPRPHLRALWLALAVLFALSGGCSSGGSQATRDALMGRWQSLDSGETAEFNADGTAVVFDDQTRIAGRWAFSEPDRLQIDHETKASDEPPRVYRAAVAGNELVLIDPTHGRSYGYYRLSDKGNAALDSFLRAQELRMQGKLEESIAAYQAALKSDPHFAQASVGLGMSWLGSDRPDLAIKQFDAALARLPQLASAYIGRGMARLRSEEPKEAIADYNIALAIEPNNPDTMLLRAAAWRQTGNLERALAEVNEVLVLDPEHTPAWLERAGLQAQLKNYVASAADFDEVIRRDPKNLTIYLLRANVNERLGKYREAIDDYSRVIEKDPGGYDALNSQAWLLAAAPNDQVRDGKKAVELSMRANQLTKYLNPKYLSTLAAAHAEAGNFDEAVKYQQQAAVLQVNDEQDLAESRKRLQTFRLHQPHRFDPPVKLAEPRSTQAVN